MMSDGNEGLLRFPESSRITWDSSSHSLFSYQDTRCASLTLLQRCRVFCCLSWLDQKYEWIDRYQQTRFYEDQLKSPCADAAFIVLDQIKFIFQQTFAFPALFPSMLQYRWSKKKSVTLDITPSYVFLYLRYFRFPSYMIILKWEEMKRKRSLLYC